MSKELNAFLKKNKSITFTLKVKSKVFKCLSFKAKNKNELTDEVIEHSAGILRATVDSQELNGVYDLKIFKGKTLDKFNVKITPKKSVA